MPTCQQGHTTDRTSVDNFLALHPEVLVGRDALNETTANIADRGNTFLMFNKPLANIVLVQEFDADTNQRLYVVALIDDKKAEEYYKTNCVAEDLESTEEICTECSAGTDGDAEKFLFETAPPRCPKSR